MRIRKTNFAIFGKRNSALSQEKFSTSQEKFSTSQEKLSTSQEKLSTSQEKMVCTTDIEPTISQLISQILTYYLLKNAPGRRNSLVLGWSLSLSRSIDPGLPFQPALLHPGHGLKSHGFEEAGQLRVLTQADRHTQTGVTYIGH